MALTLTLLAKDANGVLHVAARGEATVRDFPASRQTHFDTLLGPQWAQQRIVLNMDDLTYLDSAAIGWLIGVQRQLSASGGTLVMHSVQPAIRNILNLLKIERVVPLLENADDAKKYFERPSVRMAAAATKELAV